MTNLTEMKCVPCEGGVPSLTKEEAEKYLKLTPQWQINNNSTGNTQLCISKCTKREFSRPQIRDVYPLQHGNLPRCAMGRRISISI